MGGHRRGSTDPNASSLAHEEKRLICLWQRRFSERLFAILGAYASAELVFGHHGLCP
jgi:hypothetical protein